MSFPAMAKDTPKFDVVFKNLASIGAKGQIWGADPAAATSPRIFTVNTPAGKPVQFFMFDNASCVQKDSDAPVNPPTK